MPTVAPTQENDDVRPQETPPTARDEAQEILTLHDGNALEAIRTLIAERDAVEDKLAFARIAMGHGYTRGWKP